MNHLYCPAFDRVEVYFTAPASCLWCKKETSTHTVPATIASIEAALETLRFVWQACKSISEYEKWHWSASMRRAEKEAFSRMKAQGDYLNALLSELINAPKES